MTTLFVFNYSASPPLANDSIVAIYDAVVFCFYQHGGAAGVFFGYNGAGRLTRPVGITMVPTVYLCKYVISC